MSLLRILTTQGLLLVLTSLLAIPLVGNGGVRGSLLVATGGHRNFLLEQMDTLNVLDFGAKGDGHTDDSKAIQNAMKACALDGRVCFIPKTKAFYLIKSTVRVPLKRGQFLNIHSNNAIIKPVFPLKNNSLAHLTAFREQTVFSIGPACLGKTAPSMSDIFDNNGGISVSISGLTINGAGLPYTAVPTGFNSLICIAMAVSAEHISISHCDFQSILGFGIMAMGPKEFDATSNKFNLVGGRGKTPFKFKVDNDQFGDAMHISAVKQGGKISITSCILQGFVKHGRRSRSGITFEFSDHASDVAISNCIISGYAKCMHIEEPAASHFSIVGCTLKDFSYGIANVEDSGTICKFTNCNFTISQNDGQDAAGASLLGLNNKSDAKLYFYGSTINFEKDCGAYQSVAQIRNFDRCVFNVNHLNIFFVASDSLVFNRCTFNGFGGDQKSFYNCCGGVMHVIIRNSSFRNSGRIFAAQSNVKLQVINTPSIKL